MSKNIGRKAIKYIIRIITWRVMKNALMQILPSRCKRDGIPEYGRFTPREIQRITSQAQLNIEELMPNFNDLENIGNYQNAYLGLLSLATYRALRKESIESTYAMNIVGDMQWQAYMNNQGIVPIIDPIRKKWLKISKKDSITILEKRLKQMMKYPYSKPGYQSEFYKDNQVICWDFYSCPMHDFYKQFRKEEMTLFRRTMCTFDYSVAEHGVEGGKYEREHCLADGDKVCDMRWSVVR
ncbi:MAG: L-2-amino-thiazoline-4-carboxylic acid hydrolase [Smithellaceae bacterium]